MASVDIKKSSEAQVEPLELPKSIQPSIDDDPVYSHQEQRRIIRKIDLRLILMLGFLHCVCLIDRGNLGTAAVAGMEQELRLVGTQYVSHTPDRDRMLSIILPILHRVLLQLHSFHLISPSKCWVLFLCAR